MAAALVAAAGPAISAAGGGQCGPQLVSASQVSRRLPVAAACQRHHLTGALLAQVVSDHQVTTQVGHPALSYATHRAQRAALVHPRVLLQRVARLVLGTAHRTVEGSWNTEGQVAPSGESATTC